MWQTATGINSKIQKKRVENTIHKHNEVELEVKQHRRTDAVDQKGERVNERRENCTHIVHKYARYIDTH